MFKRLTLQYARPLLKFAKNNITMNSIKIIPLAILSIYSFANNSWADDNAAPGLNLSPVVVTATRTEQNSFDLPVSIDVIDAEKIQEGQLQVNISESLARVPGMVAQSRGQYAQDVQISSRGFGARSQFGVRGIRLYADGIPLTMPDGQGQAGTFDLGSAKNIEVMRGPFSSLYGNSSGGVVQIFTADGPLDSTLSGSFTTGSYGTNRESIKVGGTQGNFNYIVDYSHLESDGYRIHSAVRRDLFNAKLKLKLNEDTRLTLLVTDLDQPISQDPLGLTKQQWQQNPRSVVQSALDFNTRVSKSQTQVGVKLEHDFNSDNTISLMGYGGVRKNTQFLSTPISSQSPASSSGGVSIIDRDFAGVDLHFTHKGQFANGPYSVSIGTNYDTMTDDRTGFNNFIGTTTGVQGSLRRNEADTAKNFDQYAQAQWAPIDRLSLVAGVRHSNVKIKSEDHYIVGTNKDDSGSADFTKTTPVAGMIFKLTSTVNLYANAGKGFETPTLIESAYRPDGTSGLNFSLKPSSSNNYEIGAKAFITENTRANIAVFYTETSNEIVTATNSSGRTTYQNAGGTERSGLELSLDSSLGNGFNAYVAYTYIDAIYSDSFKSCGTQPAGCKILGPTFPVTINSNNKIPGVYRETAYAEVSWKHSNSGFSTAFEIRANSKVYVDDTNQNSAPGYAILNWRGGFSQNLQNWKFSEFVRIENLANQNYVGSVKVNDANNQYYESGANRNWLLGINASYHF